MKTMHHYFASLLFSALAIAACNEDPDPFQPSTGGEKSPVIITELDGHADMIELYNPSASEQSLSGLKIRRMRVNREGADDEQTLWTGQKDLTLGPGAYLALYYVEGKEDNALYPKNLQHKFSSHKNTSIWLQDASEDRLCEFVRGTKGPGWGVVGMQKAETEEGVDYSYSLVGGVWVYALPTPGKANGEKAGEIDQTMFPVVINEVNFETSQIELYNLGKTEVDLKGFQLRWSRIKDSEADNQTVWEAVDKTVLKPGGYLVVPSLVDLKSYSSRNVHIKLRNPLKQDFTGTCHEWDDIKRGEKGAGWTTATLSKSCPVIARIPDGIGLWYVAKSATAGKTNGTDDSAGLVPDIDQD